MGRAPPNQGAPLERQPGGSTLSDHQPIPRTRSAKESPWTRASAPLLHAIRDRAELGQPAGDRIRLAWVTEASEAGRRGRRNRTSIVWSVAGGALAGALLLLIILPVAALLFSSSPRQVLRGLGDPLVLPAIRLTVLTTTASLVLV